jgi:hypothetical protein
MALNPDQFVDVFHSSYFEKPPHEMSVHEVMKMNALAPVFQKDIETVNNMDRVVFAGSREAAESRWNRDYIHKYRIPAAMVRPELWNDDLGSEKGEAPIRPTHHYPNVQGELFEMFPARITDVTPTEVIKYRNSVEDRGSISHIMPKEAINNGTIQYLGMEQVRGNHLSRWQKSNNRTTDREPRENN